MIKFKKLVTIFQNINITVLFLQNTVKYLHNIHRRIYVLISPKSNFMYIDVACEKVDMFKFWKLIIILKILTLRD